MIQLDVRADIKRMTDKLKSYEREQIPYATSIALNRTAYDLQQLEKAGASQDIERPVPFTISGIQYKRSTKANLVAKVFVEQQRAQYLQWSVFGGGRRPRRKVIIIGLTARNQYGNTPGFRAFRATLLSKRNHFEATINGTSGVWKREPKRKQGGRKDHISLVALYARQADYTKTWRFAQRAFRSARAIFRKHFRIALEAALANAR